MNKNFNHSIGFLLTLLTYFAGAVPSALPPDGNLYSRVMGEKYSCPTKVKAINEFQIGNWDLTACSSSGLSLRNREHAECTYVKRGYFMVDRLINSEPMVPYEGLMGAEKAVSQSLILKWTEDYSSFSIVQRTETHIYPIPRPSLEIRVDRTCQYRLNHQKTRKI